MADKIIRLFDVTTNQWINVKYGDLGGDLYSPVSLNYLMDEFGNKVGLKMADGKPRISMTEYYQDIGEGNMPGHSRFDKIGFTPTVASTEGDVWSKGGVHVQPAGGIQMAVVSSDNTQDKAGGTGALEVSVYYLNTLFIEQTITVALNGTTPVNTVPTNIYRVNGFRVTAAGSNGKPVGNISLTSVGGGVTYSYIGAGYNRARNSVFTVPANKTLYLNSIVYGYGYSTNQTHYCRMYLRATQNNEVMVPGIYYPFSEVVVANSSIGVKFDVPLKFVQMVDLKVSQLSTFAGIADCAYRGWIE